MKKSTYIIIAVVIVILALIGTLVFLKTKPTTTTPFDSTMLTIQTTLTMSDSQKKEYDEVSATLKKDPTNYSARFNLGRLKQQLLDYSGAEKLYLALRAEKPTDILLLNNLADLYLNMQRWNDAEITYLATFDQTYKWINAYRGLYDLYQFQLKDRRATLEPILLKGLTDFPEMESDIAIMTAAYYDELMNNRTKAIEYYKKAISLDPTNQAAKDRLAVLIKQK